MMKSLLALLLVFTLACENSGSEAPHAAAPVRATSTAETDRNCREDAARVVARLQRIEERDQRAPYVMSWSGRINTSDGRCYAEVRLFDSSIARRTDMLEINRRQLYDAVDGVLLAEHVSEYLIDKERQKLFCRAPHPSGDRSAGDRSTIGAECAAVDKLIVDRMTQ